MSTLGRKQGLQYAVLLVALVFFFSEAQAASRDTITVDGSVLRLDLDLRESAGVTGKVRSRGLSPWAKPEVKLAVWVGGVRMLNSVQGTSLEALAGRPVRPSSHIELVSTWTQDDKHLRLGFSGGLREAWTYNVTELDDSLYAVAGSQGGGLEQWIQRTYDLGIELDTVPLPFNRRLAQEARIMLDRGGSMGQGRGADWSWWAGLHLNLIRLVRSPAEAERLPLLGRPDDEQVLGPDRSDWISEVTMGWGLQLGVENNLTREWSWAMRAGWNAGLRSGVWCSIGLACRLSR